MDYECDIRPTNIDGNVYLGGIESTSLSSLQSLRIKRVITVDIQPIKPPLPHIHYLFIKANDYHSEDLLSHFEECHEFISEGKRKGEKCLVHCVAGVSRSATIVAAHLMAEKGMTADAAVAAVRLKRNIIEPNIGFLYQLNLFEKMNAKLSTANADYRQFLLKSLRYKMQFYRPWNRQQNSQSKPSVNSQSSQQMCDPLSSYFQKLQHFTPVNKILQKHDEIYKCKKCRLYLFSEANVLRNNSDDLMASICSSIFIEPLHFMLPHINNQESGQIICSNCFTKIGNFNWNHLECDCKLHIDLNCLIFKIDSKKVDAPYLRSLD